jgi:hypothetical protein
MPPLRRAVAAGLAAEEEPEPIAAPEDGCRAVAHGDEWVVAAAAHRIGRPTATKLPGAAADRLAGAGGTEEAGEKLPARVPTRRMMSARPEEMTLPLWMARRTTKQTSGATVVVPDAAAVEIGTAAGRLTLRRMVPFLLIPKATTAPPT